MITSPKAKAIVAAILTAIIGIAGQVANLNLVSGSAQHNLTVAIAIVTAIAATFGVYGQANAPTP